MEETEEKLNTCLQINNCKTPEEIFVKIAIGDIDIHKLLRAMFSEKDLLFSMFHLRFSSSNKEGFRVKIQIKSTNSLILLNEIIKTIMKRNIAIIESSSYIDSINRFVCEFGISIRNFDKLFDLCEEIETIHGVESIVKI